MRDASNLGSKQRKPRILEVVSLGVGLLLLAVFFQIRADQDTQREAGINSFLATHSSALPAVHNDSSNHFALPADTPDQSLWSEKRIKEHAESLARGGEPPLAVLSIDRLSIQVPVYDGADDHNLNRGVARVRGTARVSSEGNLGIAGHRDGFFRPLKDIQHGDIVELMTPEGLVRYEVVQTDVVNPEDVGVLAPTDERTITLVTCFPFYWVGDAPQRFIVKAVAQSSAST